MQASAKAQCARDATHLRAWCGDYNKLAAFLREPPVDADAFLHGDPLPWEVPEGYSAHRSHLLEVWLAWLRCESEKELLGNELGWVRAELDRQIVDLRQREMGLHEQLAIRENDVAEGEAPRTTMYRICLQTSACALKGLRGLVALSRGRMERRRGQYF